MKKQKTVSIKAKLLGVIIPVVIAIVVVLVVAAYQISAGTIKKYSQNLLQSSVENQASQIEAMKTLLHFRWRRRSLRI